jgi:hypothetical protein
VRSIIREVEERRAFTSSRASIFRKCRAGTADYFGALAGRSESAVCQRSTANSVRSSHGFQESASDQTGADTLRTAQPSDRKTGRPARFELSEQTRQAVDDYLKAAKKEGPASSCSQVGVVLSVALQHDNTRALFRNGLAASDLIRGFSERIRSDEPRLL